MVWVLVLCGLLAMPLLGWGATMPAFTDTPQVGFAQFVQGVDAAGTYKTIYVHADKASRCAYLNATNGDSVDHALRVRIKRTAVSYVQTTVNLPTTAGTATTAPPVDVLAAATWPGLPSESDGNPWIFLQADDELEVTYLTAFTGVSGEIIDVTVFCSNY